MSVISWKRSISLDWTRIREIPAGNRYLALELLLQLIRLKNLPLFIILYFTFHEWGFSIQNQTLNSNQTSSSLSSSSSSSSSWQHEIEIATLYFEIRKFWLLRLNWSEIGQIQGKTSVEFHHSSQPLPFRWFFSSRFELKNNTNTEWV